MNFTVEYVEYFLLIFVRISMVIAVAPFFGNANIPRKIKACIAFFLAIIVLNLTDYSGFEYNGMLDYSIILVKEAITGTLIGLGSGFCMYILSFAGNLVDMEIGFAMAMEMDPLTGVQTTISANFFTAIFMLSFLASDMHYYLIDAIYDSYELIPVGGGKMSGIWLQIYSEYLVDYFTIGFRIILPIFSCILVINIILGILAKVAPQMNMFVVGMQLKILVGLGLLAVLVTFLPGITDFLFSEMQKLTKLFVQSMT